VSAKTLDKYGGHWLGHNIGASGAQLGVGEGGLFPGAATQFRGCRVLEMMHLETSLRRRCQDNHFHGNRVTPACVNTAQIVIPMIYASRQCRWHPNDGNTRDIFRRNLQITVINSWYKTWYIGIHLDVGGQDRMITVSGRSVIFINYQEVLNWLKLAARRVCDVTAQWVAGRN